MREPRVSVIIPAYREASAVGETVRAIRAALSGGLDGDHEVLVVDDGSPDATAARAADAGARVVRLPRNRGKGAALATGLAEARGEVLLLLDADLGGSAAEAVRLLEPVLERRADMAIASFPPAPAGAGGFGMVLRLARWGVRRAGGPLLRSPLSGQRAIARASWQRIGRLDPGFGVEMGLNLDAVGLGLRLTEVPTEMRHRLTRRDWAGFRHRGRQFADVLRAIVRRWRLSSGAGGLA